MNISLKWIGRLKWILIFILSMPIGFVVTKTTGFSIWTWEYWAICLPAQYILNSWIDNFIERLYDRRKCRKLRFKEYVKDKKAGAFI
jgi:hypothetical protein